MALIYKGWMAHFYVPRETLKGLKKEKLWRFFSEINELTSLHNSAALIILSVVRIRKFQKCVSVTRPYLHSVETLLFLYDILFSVVKCLQREFIEKMKPASNNNNNNTNKVNCEITFKIRNTEKSDCEI